MYPEAARAKRIQGVVTVEATVDSTGNVVDTRVLSGPMELRRAAQQSVLAWHFAMDSSATTRQVRVNFDLTGVPEPRRMISLDSAPPSMDAASRAAAEAKVNTLRSQVQDQVKQAQDPAQRAQAMTKLNELQASINALQTRMGPPSIDGRRLNQIVVVGLTDTLRNDLISRLGVHEGDIMTSEAMQRAHSAALAFDEHMNVGTLYGKDNEVTLTLSMPGVRMGLTGAAGGSVSVGMSEPKPNVPGRITIGGNVQQAKLISQPRPQYPALAKQARISGAVHLAAVIGKEGDVIDLKVISGHPLLIPAALEAVKQWVYQKTLLNGEPVEVITQIDVNFTLSDEPIQQ
jgi:TonB family protein